MIKKLFLCIGLFTVLLCSGQNDKLFDQATTAYNAGEFEKAIELYDQILNSGQHSAAVYYNLGNAYYKQNEIAESIYYYEKALLLSPNDDEIKTNLSYAQNMTLDAIGTVPQTGLSKLYKNVTGKLTFDQWAYLAIASMMVFVLLYIAFYYFNFSSRKRWAFIGSIIALFICILAVVFAYVQRRDFNAQRPAIIFAEEIAIKSEPNESSTEIFVLHEGTKVNVAESLNDWNKIVLSDGKTGWIQNEKLRLLKDF
ncbi:MAG: tetratricopeptide repeat protein [Maribacter sp.]